MTTAADALSEEEQNELREAFNLFDKDNDGLINAAELGMAMRALAQHPTEQLLKELVTKPDTEEGEASGNGFVMFTEFINIMAKKLGDTEPEEELTEAFRILDKEGTGQMSAAYLRHIMTTYGEKLTDEEAEEMIREADDDADGLISYQEFAQVLTSD